MFLDLSLISIKFILLYSKSQENDASNDIFKNIFESVPGLTFFERFLKKYPVFSPVDSWTPCYNQRKGKKYVECDAASLLWCNRCTEEYSS